MSLNPPNPPFNRNESSASSTSSLQGDDAGRFRYSSPVSSPSRSRNSFSAPDSAGLGLSTAESNVSLTVNYLPTKFSNPQLVQRRRRSHRNPKSRGDLSPGAGVVPKMGGGVEAFRSGEARMSGVEDDDDDHHRVEDGSSSGWAKKPPRHSKPRWNRFKWTLFFTNLIASALLPSCMRNLFSDKHIAHDLFLRRADCMPPHLVQCMVKSGHHPSSKHHRARDFHRCCCDWDLHLPARVGRDLAEQPLLSRHLLSPHLDYFSLPPYSRLSYLQTAFLQPGGQGECTMVTGPRLGGPTPHPERASVLWIFLSVRRSDN